AHFANGHGYLVEFVAGRVESNETLVDAARRECREEIGVAPEKTVELLSYLSTAGLTDEEVTIFLAAVDASRVREGPQWDAAFQMLLNRGLPFCRACRHPHQDYADDVACNFGLVAKARAISRRRKSPYENVKSHEHHGWLHLTITWTGALIDFITGALK